MDNNELKSRIKNFAVNVGLATAMFAISSFYIPLALTGKGNVWLAVVDVALFCGDVFFAREDWKLIKNMLDEDEREKSAE